MSSDTKWVAGAIVIAWTIGYVAILAIAYLAPII